MAYDGNEYTLVMNFGFVYGPGGLLNIAFITPNICELFQIDFHLDLLKYDIQHFNEFHLGNILILQIVNKQTINEKIN